jgi:hypothetical protein
MFLIAVQDVYDGQNCVCVRVEQHWWLVWLKGREWLVSDGR